MATPRKTGSLDRSGKRTTLARLSRMSIGNKLVATLVGLNAFGFLLASGGLLMEHRKDFRSALARDLTILTQVIGDNCRAALAFGESSAAAESLAALRADPHIIEAVLLDADGDRFAVYARDGALSDTTPTGSFQGTFVDNDEARAGIPIVLEGRTIGHLLVRSDLMGWKLSLRRFVLVAGLLFLSISLLLLGIALKVQRRFTAPIADLVTIAQRVTETEDYRLRARKHSRDEMGALVDGFNTMLAEIESRDTELRRTRDALRVHLEQLEEQRQQLAESNLALLREVREREHAERAMARYARSLKESNSELEQFAYVASHDLQEPLRGIAGSLQLLERRYDAQLDEDGRQLIGFAVDGARRLQRLIVDLLSYSRINTRGLTLEPVDCEALRKQVLADLAVAVVEAKAEVTHDPLPTIQADRTQLPLLFQNLISNALKFRGDAAPQVHVGAERRDDDWVFSVRDNGIGIEQRFSRRIFEICQRLHNPTEYPGTGIGLAIAKRIVERHQGEIWIESEPGSGTTFFFSIPDRQGELHG